MNKKTKGLILLILAGLVVVIASEVFIKPVIKNAVKRAYKTSEKDTRKQDLELKPAINGLMVEPEVAERRPIAVMVENHPDARPQSGLSEADIVYETLAEGGITRFMAVYQTKDAKNIGPVRSARGYYALLADELGAVYAHVGGSNEVIAQLKDGIYKNLSDANEYYNGTYFGRITARPAPHNVYTSMKKLEGLIEYHGFPNLSTFKPWNFKDDRPAASSTAAKIQMSFSESAYDVSYAYDPALNAYKRSLAGRPHADAESKEQIKAKNVIVQVASVAAVPNDPLLHVDINLYGSGKAYVFLDGKSIEGTWKKEAGDRTRYYDLSGKEISFNRGSTWVEIIPQDKLTQLKWQ